MNDSISIRKCANGFIVNLNVDDFGRSSVGAQVFVFEDMIGLIEYLRKNLDKIDVTPKQRESV